MSETLLDPHENGEVTPIAGVTPTGTTAQNVDVEPTIQITADGNQITRGDAKYIRAEALIAERAEKQQLKQQLDQVAPFLPEFREFIENKRNGRNAAVTAATSGAPDGYGEDDLKAVATIRGYYTEDGQSLDLNRARFDLQTLDRITQRQVQTAIAPVIRDTAADRAARNREAALARTYVDGRPIADPKFVQQAFDALPADLAADPNVANLVQVIAAGLESLDDRQNGRGARREANFAEGPVGRFDSSSRGLSSFAQRAAQARGYSQEQWAKLEQKPTPDARLDRDGGIILEGGI